MANIEPLAPVIARMMFAGGAVSEAAEVAERGSVTVAINFDYAPHFAIFQKTFANGLCYI